jgi:hypothetical protein
MSESHENLRLKDLARSKTWVGNHGRGHGHGHCHSVIEPFRVLASPPFRLSKQRHAHPQPNLIPAISVSSPLSVHLMHLMHLPGFGFPMQRSDVSYCSIASSSNPPPPPSTSVEDLLVPHAAMRERLPTLVTSCTIPQRPTTSCCRKPHSATVRQPESMGGSSSSQ